jgi:pyruvate/2-oxoglutarate dehydrogenase complex dihydrolipoamide dehydrogenase (E3) component
MRAARDNGRRFRFGLAIVGSGGGAFAAAIAARRRGLRVAMFERETIGGTCVNVGCIPSKALLAAAEARHRARVNRFPGIKTEAGTVDFAALIAGKREIVERMRQEKYVDLAHEYGIELIEGDARLVDGPALGVDGRHVEAENYDAILAGVYAIEAGRTVAELADGWDPYLTIGEAVRLAALAFTRDPSKLSCCAA